MNRVAATVLVTAAMIFVLLAMYGVYVGVDYWIVQNKEQQACLERVAERTITQLENDNSKYRNETDLRREANLHSVFDDMDQTAKELCRRKK